MGVVHILKNVLFGTLALLVAACSEPLFDAYEPAMYESSFEVGEHLYNAEAGLTTRDSDKDAREVITLRHSDSILIWIEANEFKKGLEVWPRQNFSEDQLIFILRYENKNGTTFKPETGRLQINSCGESGVKGEFDINLIEATMCCMGPCEFQRLKLTGKFNAGWLN